MKMALDRPQLISLAAGFTDNASLPVEETSELLNEILRSKKLARASLQYGSTGGDPELRQQTTARLRRADQSNGAVYNSERMIISHGSQQLLYLITECLCDEGDIVLVEDPTYFVYLGILQSRGVVARGITLQQDGIDLGKLEAVLESLKQKGELPRLKMLYLVSYFQNPSGVTTSLEKKRAALEVLARYEKAAGHPIYLLEDAAYRDLRFSGEDVPSALSISKYSDRVLYAGTFSKPFATGVRVGYGILPEALGTVVLRVKGNHDFGTSNLLQQLLLRALESGLYDQHLPKLRARYARKAAVMASAIENSFPEIAEWIPATGGLYVWARLPARMQTGPHSKIFQRALKDDVLYVPGELCYANDATRKPVRSEMRLSFGSASEADIREGITRLGNALAQNSTPPGKSRPGKTNRETGRATGAR